MSVSSVRDECVQLVLSREKRTPYTADGVEIGINTLGVYLSVRRKVKNAHSL